MWPLKKVSEYSLLHKGDPDTETASLPPDESEKDLSAVYVPRHRRRIYIEQFRQLLFLTTAALCLYLALISAWRTTLHPRTGIPTYYRKTLTCGNTTEQAEARGCEFDLLSHNWIPSPCIDHEIMAEFREYVRSPERKYSAWPYYVDREGKEWIPNERALALRAGQHVVTTQEEHLAHCAYLIRRIHRAMLGITRADDTVSKYPHTVHCINELKDPDKKPLDRLSEGYWVGFTTCTIDAPF